MQQNGKVRKKFVPKNCLRIGHARTRNEDWLLGARIMVGRKVKNNKRVKAGRSPKDLLVRWGLRSQKRPLFFSYSTPRAKAHVGLEPKFRKQSSIIYSTREFNVYKSSIQKGIRVRKGNVEVGLLGLNTPATHQFVQVWPWFLK